MENNENEKKSEKADLVFNTPNELKIKVTKFTGQTILDEDCCTSLNMVVKNDGQIQGNFLGAYNEELLKLLKRATKEYFKVLKKNLKSKPNDENISVESNEKNKSETDKKNADTHTKKVNKKQTQTKTKTAKETLRK